VQRRSIDVIVHQLRFQSDQCIQIHLIPANYQLSSHHAVSTALLMVLAFGGTQAFQLSFLVPPNKPVEGKAPSDRRRRRMRTTTQRR
jgi:hypothetical protein